MIVAPPPSLDFIQDDTAYNRVPESSVAAKASYTVTEDAHLLKLRQYGGVVILNPTGYMTIARLGKQR